MNPKKKTFQKKISGFCGLKLRLHVNEELKHLSDLLEYVHAQVRGQVGYCWSAEVGQGNLRERLCAQRFSLFVAFQTHVLQNETKNTSYR